MKKLVAGVLAAGMLAGIGGAAHADRNDGIGPWNKTSEVLIETGAPTIIDGKLVFKYYQCEYRSDVNEYVMIHYPAELGSCDAWVYWIPPYYIR